MPTSFGNYYNPNDVQANEGFDKLPPGEYPAIATEGAVIDTKDRTGLMVKFKFQIIEGPMKDRTLFNNYNIKNKNPTAEQIGRGQLKHFATVCGKPNATDAAELLNIPVVLVVGVQKNNPDYNEVKNVKPYGVASGAVKTAQAGTAKPSWMKS